MAKNVKIQRIDSFDVLPTELKLDILHRLPDLTSVRRVSVASEAMHRVATSYKRELIRHWIKRQPQFLRELVMDFLQLLSTGLCNISGDVDATECFFLIACRIDWLTSKFLDVHLGRSNRLFLEHPVDEWDGLWSWDLDESGQMMKTYPPSKQWIFPPMEDPDWYEHARVIRVIWQMHLCELQQLCGINHELDRDRLRYSQLQRRYTHHRVSYYSSDQSDTMQDFLNDLGLRVSNFDLKELQRAFTEDHIDSFKLRDPLGEEVYTERHRVWAAELIEAGDPKVKRAFEHVGGGMCLKAARLMAHVDWRPFRRLGLSMWGAERLCRMGVLNNWWQDKGNRTTWCDAPVVSDSARHQYASGVGASYYSYDWIVVWRSMMLDGERLSPDPRDATQWPEIPLMKNRDI